jgi:ribokinase
MISGVATGTFLPVAGVLVVGAVNVDLVVAAPRLPGPGETVVGDAVQRFGGGKGANAAVAAARAGAAVALVGAVGDDDTGAGALEELRADGVDTTAVAVLDGVATGVALIVVDAAGENQIAVGAGANAAVPVDAVTAAVRDSPAGCVLVSTEIPGPAVIAAVRAARAPCVLNPAPVVDEVVDLLDAGPILTPNRSECLDLAARLGAPTGDLPTAARRIQDRSGAPVVVTLGGDGVLVLLPGAEPETVPARPAQVRDTTGAGDTFNGVLAARLAAGDGFTDAVRTAVTAASLSVTQVGARAGMPTAAEIGAFATD